MNDDELKSLPVDKLEALVRHHNALYWDKAKPEIDDYQYDKLVRRLREVAPKSAVLDEMGPGKPTAADPTAAFKHKQRMLSLDKCYSDDELGKWAQEFEGEVVVSPKFDGIACSLHYSEKGELTLAVTRGDGEVGENITVNAREIKDIPRTIEARGIEVRGEIYMRLSVFKGYKDQGFANPRNLAAGAIKQKDTKKSAAYNLSFAAYDLLGTDLASEWAKLDFLAKVGFAPIERERLARDKLHEGYVRMAQKRPGLDYEIDGVVFKVDSVAEQKRLGSTSHHPRYAIAYKFQGDSGTTILKDIEWSVARSGAITPVALIEPVNLSGAMVSRASLHNHGFIARLGVTPGCEIVVMRRGGVIPNVELVSKPGKGTFAIPTKCPSCGRAVRTDGDFTYCANPSTCRDAVIGQLSHFAAATGMLGFGDSVLGNAYDTGALRRPADFYTLTEKQLLELDRMAEKGARKLLGEVDKARTLDLGTFLRAFGMHEVGKSVSALLVEHFHSLDRIYKVTEEELGAIHGVGGVIAKAVVRSIADAKVELEAVRAHVKIVEPTHTAAAAATGPFAGKSFVFTGKMATMERKEAETIVRSLGGAPLDAVNKTLTCLVIGDKKTDEKSTKQKAAEKLIAQGATIEVISETEFLVRVERARATASQGGAQTGGGTRSAPSEGDEEGLGKAVEAKPTEAVHAPVEATREAHQAPRVAADAPPVSSPTAPLSGKAFVFAGKLAAMSLGDAGALIAARGGTVRGALDEDVTHVVVGAKGKPGASLVEARARQGRGVAIEILEEADFVKLVGVPQPALL